MKIKTMVDKESTLLKILLWCYNHLPFNNCFKGRGVSIKLARLSNCKVKVKGIDSSIAIGKGVQLKNCKISVLGNHNKVIIKDYVSAIGLDICIENDNNEIVIGERTTFDNNVKLACVEGKRIGIGEDCMFSANISIRVGDSHSITDLEGRRINPSRDVKIGNHVWIGNTVLITKGVEIKENSIVGTGSVVTRRFVEPNVVLAGNPAQIVKRGISWDRQRLPISEE